MNTPTTTRRRASRAEAWKATPSTPGSCRSWKASRAERRRDRPPRDGRIPRVSAHGDQLHPLVGGFRDAAAYDAGRPRYGPPVASLLLERLELAPGAPVLEL